MFIAMNRFQVNEGKEAEFITIWKNRESLLAFVPGFKSFNLLQGATNEAVTLFSSHVVWEDRAAFDTWTTSEAFRQAHANVGVTKTEGIYAGKPKLELFDAVL